MTKQSVRFRGVFFLLILLSCFQRLILISFGSFSLKVFHVYSVVFLVMMVLYRKVTFPSFKLIAFYFYILIISLVKSRRWGVGGLIVNYTFGIYLLMIFCTFGTMFTFEDWLLIFRRVAIIMLIAVIINAGLQFDKIVYFYNNTWMGHPAINTLWGGGVNLEATWLALLGFSFYKNKLKWVYAGLSTIISAILASRTGILINVMCLFWLMIAENRSKDVVKNMGRIIAIMFLAIGAVMIAMKYGLLDAVVGRFQSIGDDTGSLGRERMWKYVFRTIQSYPFGVGIGNVMKALSVNAGIRYSDSNLHNLYLQNIIELGWIGGLWYIAIVIDFIKRELKNLFKDPFVAMLFVYIVTSTIQFKGGEPLTFSLIGVYLCEQCIKSESKNLNVVVK